MALDAGTRLGHYEILSSLGAGGMGEVYRAKDTKLGREVAIKVLPEAFSNEPERMARLEREARVLASLNHPHIAVIHDLDNHEGTPFLVLELVEGETLAETLERGPLQPEDCLTIARQIAEALESAHAAGVIHRDLKPANIMLTPEGPGQSAAVRVLDFGLATARGAGTQSGALTLTAEGSIMGTAPYMSPEQWRGESVDSRTDLWAWGCLLYELVSGARAFDAKTHSDTTVAVLTGEPDWTLLPAELPTGVRELLGRCLEKDRDQRIGDALEVRRALEGLAGPSGNERIPESSPNLHTAVTRSYRTPLVGRETEAAELRECLDRASAGRGGLISLTGEPGIGKTRLSWDLIEAAQDRRFLTLVGHCTEGEGSPPYAPWIEILESLVRQVPRQKLRALFGDGAPEIARLLPELGAILPELPPPLDLPPEDSRHHLFRRLGELLNRLGEAQPTLVLLEDLHWADSSTLMFLGELAPRLAEMPVMILATYRDTDLDASLPLARTLEQLVRERLVQRIHVDRLSEQGVRDLLAASSGRRPPDTVVTAVHEGTEGNPFFIEELYEQMLQSGGILDSQGGWKTELLIEQLEVSEGVRLVVGRRLDLLPQAARSILTAAAVIGRRFDYKLLEKLAAVEADTLLDVVEAAEQRHLIESDTSSTRDIRYQFAHELVRQTLLHGLSLPRRQRLHARIADALDSISPHGGERRIVALAHHLYQAGTAVDGDRTARVLEQAADQALSTGANIEAERALSQALEVVSELGPSDETSEPRLALIRRLAPLQVFVGRYGDALASYQVLQDSLVIDSEPIDAKALAGIEMWMGRIQYERGDYERARTTLRGALTRAEGLGDRARTAACCQHLGDIHFSSGSLPKAIELFLRSLAISEKAGDRRGIAASNTYLANALGRAGRLKEAIAAARRALALGEELGDERRSLWALNMLAQALAFAGDLKEHEAAVERAQEIADRIGDYRGRAWARTQRGFLLEAQGDFEGALPLADEFRRKGQESGGFQHEVAASMARCASLLLRMSRVAEALDHCRRCLDLTLERGNRLESGQAYRVLAEIHAVREYRDREKADEYLTLSLEAFREAGAELDVAHSYLVGACNAKAFGSSDARSLAELARASFERLGAKALLQQATGFLNDLAPGPN